MYMYILLCRTGTKSLEHWPSCPYCPFPCPCTPLTVIAFRVSAY